MDIAVRKFRDGDEFFLSELYFRTYSKFTGFVKKNSQEWKKLFVEHPYIGSSNVIVGYDKKNGAIFGYIAFSEKKNPLFPDKELDSVIYELNLVNGRRGLLAGKELLGYVINECNSRNSSGVSIRIPYDNRGAYRLLQNTGFGRIAENQTVCVSIFDFKKIIDNRINQVGDCSFLKNSKITLTQDFSNKIIKVGTDGEIIININQNDLRKTEIICGVKIFSDILLGSLSPYVAFLQKKIQIKPFISVVPVMNELSKISMKNRWVIPAVDWR